MIKRSLALILSVIIALSLAACGGNQETEPETGKPKTSLDTPANAPTSDKSDSDPSNNDANDTADIPAAPAVDWDKAAKAPAGLTAAAESDFSYEYSSDLSGIVIKGYSGSAASVLIPATIEDETVVRISDFGNEALEYVYFPESLKEINGSAFDDCINLTLVIPENITIIGENISPDVKNLALSDNMLGISKSNLPFFQSLADAKVERIRYEGKTYSFDENTRLETASQLYTLFTGGNFETDIETASDWEYEYVDYTDTGYDIKGMAVTRYKSQSEKIKVTIPSEIEGMPFVSIGIYDSNGYSSEQGVFENKSKIIEVIIPNNIKVIGHCALGDMKGLNTVDIPSNVIIMGEMAFSNTAYKNVPITEIILHEGLEVIWANTFIMCDNLTTLNIPDSVTKVLSHGNTPSVFIGDGDTNVAIYKGVAYKSIQGRELAIAINGN